MCVGVQNANVSLYVYITRSVTLCDFLHFPYPVSWSMKGANNSHSSGSPTIQIQCMVPFQRNCSSLPMASLLVAYPPVWLHSGWSFKTWIWSQQLPVPNVPVCDSWVSFSYIIHWLKILRPQLISSRVASGLTHLSQTLWTLPYLLKCHFLHSLSNKLAYIFSPTTSHHYLLCWFVYSFMIWSASRL